MKNLITTVVGLAAVGVSAQSMSSVSTIPHAIATSPTTIAPVYVTEYFYDCTTAPPPVPSSVTPITVTDKTTRTICPLCTESGVSHAAQYTTTYETVLTAFCSTGLTASTYTVTAPCSETGIVYPSTYVPPGLTVTSTVCTVCGTVPITATLTIPTSCISSSGAPTSAAPVATPAAPGSKPAPAPVPAPQPAKYETNATSAAVSPPVVSPGPSTSPIMPYEGGATVMAMGLEMFLGVMGVVGVMAFAL